MATDKLDLESAVSKLIESPGGVEFIISDAHLGRQAAIQSTFIGASWQRCRVHFMREALKLVKHA